jgi:hypothetical protein
MIDIILWVVVGGIAAVGGVGCIAALIAMTKSER